MKKRILILFLSTLGLASCQKNVYLTGTMMHALEENELDVTKVQFYNDNPLTLEREVPSSNAKIKSGKVVFKNGRFINRITLDKNTPGMVQKTEDGVLSVAFERGEGEAYLRFSPIAGEKGEYFYQLTDANGSPNFSRLDYDGNTYLVVMNGSSRIRLMLAKSTFSNTSTKVRKMKGVKIK